MAESDALFVNPQNQLLFNLAMPLSALKMVHRPTPPQAIHIEKVDGGYTYTAHPPHSNNNHNHNHHHHRHNNNNNHHHHHQQQHHHSRLHDVGSDVAESRRQQLRRPLLLTDAVASKVFEQAMTLAKLDFKQRKRGDDVSESEHPHPTPNRNSKSSETKLLTKTTATSAAITTSTTTTATNNNNSSNKRSQGVRVVERSSSAKVKNVSSQVSRKNTNQPCQNTHSPEPTPLSHLPATTNSPPTRDNQDCNRQKFQKIHRDISDCLTELQTILSSFIKEGLNESSGNELEVRSSNQDLTIVKVVSRKLYSIKQQALELKRLVIYIHRDKVPQAIIQNKDIKYLINRLASIFQGIHRIFLDMCRYLKKEPTYTLSPNMVFVCVVNVIHMLNVLSLLIDIWSSEMSYISSKTGTTAIDSLHEMISNTKMLCSQFQCDDKSQPQTNLLNKLGQRPNFTAQCSKQPDIVKSKDKDRNRMKATTSRTISAKGKTSMKTGSVRSLASKKTSVIYPADLQHHRKALPTSGRHKPSVVQRQLTLHGGSETHKTNTPKFNNCSTSPSSVPVVPSGRPESFDEWHVRDVFHQLAQSYGREDLPKSRNPVSELDDDGKDYNKNCKRPKQSLPDRHTLQNNGPTTKTNDLDDGPSRGPISGSASDKETVDSTETLLQTYLGMSSIDKMLTRLQEIEEEQLQIRQKWFTLDYPSTSFQKPPAPTNGVQVGAEAQTTKQTQEFQQCAASPKAITFTKEETRSTVQCYAAAPSHHHHHYYCHTKVCCSAVATVATVPPTSSSSTRRLFVQKHTLDAVRKNRAAYLLYLKKSAYHQVDTFDPWDLTERISDAIATDCVADVLGELQQLSDDIIQQIYEDEFTAGSIPTTTLQNQ